MIFIQFELFLAFHFHHFHYEPPNKLRTILIDSFSLSFSFPSLYSSTSLRDWLSQLVSPSTLVLLQNSACLEHSSYWINHSTISRINESQTKLITFLWISSNLPWSAWDLNQISSWVPQFDTSGAPLVLLSLDPISSFNHSHLRLYLRHYFSSMSSGESNSSFAFF